MGYTKKVNDLFFEFYNPESVYSAIKIDKHNNDSSI
jgi:hypothetical protein